VLVQGGIEEAGQAVDSICWNATLPDARGHQCQTGPDGGLSQMIIAQLIDLPFPLCHEKSLDYIMIKIKIELGWV